MEKLFKLDQIATNCNCTLAAVRRWRQENRIAVIKVGRLVRVAESELDRIVREGLRPTSKGGRR
jgi:excisionase family DNA binding protein